MKKDPIPIIDFHGRSTDEVFDLLDQFITKHKNEQQVCIIIGKGKGLIKKKVLEYLKMAHYSWIYEKVHGLSNEGALIVDMN